MTPTRVLHGLCVERRDGEEYRVYDLTPQPIIQAGMPGHAAAAPAESDAAVAAALGAGTDVQPLTAAVALDCVPKGLLPAWSSVRFRPDKENEDPELGVQIRVELYDPTCSADPGAIAHAVRERVKARFAQDRGRGAKTA